MDEFEKKQLEQCYEIICELCDAVRHLQEDMELLQKKTNIHKENFKFLIPKLEEIVNKKQDIQRKKKYKGIEI
jgi:uncharacterized protein YllA (UPF0747 family)